MTKKFVLDTCVLLHDADSIFKFQEHEILIPIVVLEELDKFKKGNDETARNSRQVARYLDELRKEGSLSEGIKLEGGGSISVLQKGYHSVEGLDIAVNDHKILAVAKTQGAVLVTNDINLRVKADSVGVKAEPYGKKKAPLSELYKGISEYAVPRDTFNMFKRAGWIEKYDNRDLRPNEYLFLVSDDGARRTQARYDAKRKRIVKLIDIRDGVFNIRAKNDEQRFAIDALLNDDVKLVSLIGQAGTGKTLIAVAAGLEKMINEQEYSKMLVARPIQPMGKDIGYLPGSIEEKLNPWMQPIYDNLEFIFDLNNRHTHKPKKRRNKKQQEPVDESAHSGKNYAHLIDSGLLSVEALTYIRGRSIPSQYMIIDEAQNLTPHEVKTIVTRAGEGTKIILTGDCEQIDSPYLDEMTNGLAYAVDKMKEETITAHVTLREGERSELAKVGSQLL